MYGVKMALNAKLNVVQMEREMNLSVTGLIDINLVSLEETGEYCCMVNVSEEISDDCSEHNIFCTSLATAPQFKCSYCCLGYHFDCAMMVKMCGCTELLQLGKKIKDFSFDHQQVKRRIQQLHDEIKDIVGKLATGRFVSLRSRLITKLVSTGSCVELEEINLFYKMLPEKCRSSMIDAIKNNVLNDPEVMKALQNTFELNQLTAMISNYLLPEAFVTVFKLTLAGYPHQHSRQDVSRLMVERTTYNLSINK